MSANGDYRGGYGFGRSAHGGDPSAQYSFGAPKAPTPLQAAADLLARLTETTEARVFVRDLEFLDDEAYRAEISFFIACGDDAFDVTLNLPVNQQGNVDEALAEGKARLADMFRAAIADLETRPLRRA
jgi:hypothetical protein